MKRLALPRDDWRLVIAGAILTGLAYPPFHLLIPSFVCLTPAVALLAGGAADARPFRRHAVQGFWFGLLAQGLVLYWMVIALWRFTWMAALGYFATVVVLALYASTVFGLTGWVCRRTGVGLVLAFPVLWTAADWVIGHQGDVRFPWLGLGTSLTGFPTLVQIADVVGARGLTYLLALANTALAVAWLERRTPRRAARLGGAVAVGLLAVAAYGLVRERTLALRPVGRVAVLQPNVGFDEKWQVHPDSIFRRTVALAERAIRETSPDLVLWPEAAVPAPFVHYPAFEVATARLSRVTATPQLVGGLHLEPQPYRYFNSAFLFDSLGRSRAQPVYHKQYLVPITERVPFLPPEWFRIRFFGGFSEGARGPVYDTAVGRFGVLICYESIFENLARDYRRRGADFLVNITNDAWFGRTSAPYQHAAHLVMRAIENRVGIARAANTGISEFIDPMGREHRRTALFVEAYVTDTLVTSDARTFYARAGDWVGLLAVALAALLVGWAWWRR